jgi:L-cysteate sulfo-lyase
MDLTRFPRVHLAHLPTPLEPLKNLSRALGGPDIYVKRDDCTGLAGGGNKTRKLEFLVADAIQKNADTLVTVGATQSNHVRQSIAAAAKTGLKIEVLLEKRVDRGDDYALNGNIMLDQLMGGVVYHCGKVADLDVAGKELADKLRADGRMIYFFPAGGSSAVGALGYIGCATEMLAQAGEMGVQIDHIVVACGSQGTQAGLLVGLAGSNAAIPVLGMSVGRSQAELEGKVFALASETADLAGVSTSIERENVVCDDRFIGEGYGQPTDAMIEAVHLCARLEGLLLDPVYTGKAMSGLIAKIRAGDYKKGQSVVFVHTGGQAALHAYRATFDG